MSDNGLRECGFKSRTFERQLGLTEASYYLPSREAGANDMTLSLGFKCPPWLVERDRISTVWAILRSRHPLLACKIKMLAYDDIRFQYTSFASAKEALADANKNLGILTSDLTSQLNGPRQLLDDKLSQLVISRSTTEANEASVPLPSPPLSPTSFFHGNSTDIVQEAQDFDIFIMATHCIGDGMSLNHLFNDLFKLVGNEALTNRDLTEILTQELKGRWGVEEPQGLPPAVEEQLPPAPETNQRFRFAASKVDFENHQRQQIGGQTFPKRHGPRKILIRRKIIEEEKSKTMLKACKSNCLSISSAFFAITNLAWARTWGTRLQPELPVMIYSAMSLRPYLYPRALPRDSYHFLSIGYFNVVLPAFFPKSGDKERVKRTFWHRAKMAKDQSMRVGKSPLLVSRQNEMARQRVLRARQWAEADDRTATALSPPSTPLTQPTVFSNETAKSVASRLLQLQQPPKKKTSVTPSTCLIGVSVLGNLDILYQTKEYPSIKLHTMSGAPRQRSGGMLIYGYTFLGKLWLDLMYDENAFEREVVDQFWTEFADGLEEMLV